MKRQSADKRVNCFNICTKSVIVRRVYHVKRTFCQKPEKSFFFTNCQVFTVCSLFSSNLFKFLILTRNDAKLTQKSSIFNYLLDMFLNFYSIRLISSNTTDKFLLLHCFVYAGTCACHAQKGIMILPICIMPQ